MSGTGEMPTPLLQDLTTGSIVVSSKDKNPSYSKVRNGRSPVQGYDENKQLLPELRSSRTVDKTKPLPTSLQSDFLPEDVLLAITQPPPSSDKLGPPTRYRNLAVTDGVTKKAPANVWNHPKRRSTFSHLTKNTPCVCGAGKDISFLYDIPKAEEKLFKADGIDQSGVRMEEQQEHKKGLKLPDTLIPEEYHIVKNKGVLGLEYYEDEFATQPEDHEAHLVVFPSMHPVSRYEVIKLKKALLDMLDKVGLEDIDSDLKGPTQMHNLLELIKKEQNIYNMVFHELIRQVSVECVERGQLLSDLRGKYNLLLNKVPKQIKGLHEEVLAQRALDRRLTEELMRFKSTIGVLTSELSEVKQHDNEVTKQANKAKEDLKSALADSQKNASLLAEYHSLYELQRKRLEKQVTMLSEEREIWSTAAYSLALKVMEEHSLNSSKRLHVSEKAWAKLANHFTILLSDKDTVMLTRLQEHVDKWRELVDDFNRGLAAREETMKQELNLIIDDVRNLAEYFEQNLLSKDGHLLRQPDREKLTTIYNDLRRWQDSLGHESEKFGGDVLLSGQDALQKIHRQMEAWTDCALQVFNRHRAEAGKNHPDHDDMLLMNEEIETLIRRFHVRVSGENGVATGLIHLSNALEIWESKISSLVHGANPIPDHEWLRFYQSADDWCSYIEESMEVIGSSQKEEDRNERRPHEEIVVGDVSKRTQKWLASTTNSIDSEDAKLVEQVTTLHTEMVKWMVQMLLRLAPDRKKHSKEAKEAVLLASTTVGELQSSAKSLFDRLTGFTQHVSLCCNGIVMATMQSKIDAREDDVDREYQELQRLKSECDDWVRTAQLMLCELTGEEFTDVSPKSDQPPAQTAVQSDSQIDAAQSEVQPAVQSDVVQSEVQAAVQSDAVLSEVQAAVQSDAAKSDGETVVQSDGEALIQSECQEVAVTDDVVKSEGQTAHRAGDKEDGISMEEPEQTKTEDGVGTNDRNTETSPEKSTLISSETPAAEADKDVERLEVIGFDANTHTFTLQQDPEAAPRERDIRSKPDMPVKPENRPVTPNTKKAYEALAAVDNLNQQLLDAEERAQQLEEKAMIAETTLKEEQEKVRELERQLSQLKSELNKDEKPKSATSSVTSLVKQPTPAEQSEPAKSQDAKDKSSKPTSRSSSRSSGKSKKK